MFTSSETALDLSGSTTGSGPWSGLSSSGKFTPETDYPKKRVLLT